MAGHLLTDSPNIGRPNKSQSDRHLLIMSLHLAICYLHMLSGQFTSLGLNVADAQTLTSSIYVAPPESVEAPPESVELPV